MAEPNSKEILHSLLGSKVICQLSDGRTATGNLICVDRLRNAILADCVCQQEITSAHYTQITDPPVKAFSSRYLQHAMIPGDRLVSMKCESQDYETALEKAKAGKIIGTLK